MQFALADVNPLANPPAPADPVYHFNYHEWIPASGQLIRGGAVAAVILVVGLLLYLSLRKYIVRARLSVAYLIALSALVIYSGVAGVKPDRLLARDDLATLWLERILVASLVFAGIRALDRLLIVPLMTRGGKVPVHRFLHQILSILIILFAILGFGAWGFGWDIDKFLAGSAVISIVLGLALQETLGNFFSGLVMQASSPFAIGDWIICADVEGRVVDMTWRAVTICTLEDNYVHLPNGTVAKEQIVNFYNPTTVTARMISVGLDCDIPPDDAVAVLKAAALEAHGVSQTPEPFVFLHDFGESANVYNVKFWISEPALHKKIEHAVRTSIWYRLKQKNYNIPFPIRTVEYVSLEKKQRRQGTSAADMRYDAIAGAWLFSPLSTEEKRELAAGASDIALSAGQALFRQGDFGDSLYVIRKGTVDVIIHTAGAPDTKVATLKEGDFFGEMSALTGQARTATIRAATPLACVEIGKDDLQAIFTADPGMMEKLSKLIAERNAERDLAAQGAAAKLTRDEVVKSTQKTLFGRMMKFFGGNAIAAKP